MNIETFNFPMVSLEWFLERLEEQYKCELEDFQFDANGAPIVDSRNGLRKHREPAPMLALGKAGIGKTEGVRGIAKKMDAYVKSKPDIFGAGQGVGFKEIRLVNYEATDIIGIPYKNEYNMTDHATNVLLPRPKSMGGEDYEYGIILVDEFTSAEDNIQVPILQLMDSSRSVGNYHLPDGWKIIVAGNGPDDGGTFRSLPGTVISRAACFYVTTDKSSWLSWAKDNGIHSTIRAYVKANPSSLHEYAESSDESYDRAFACPRSWTRLSTSLYDWDKIYRGSDGKPDWSTNSNKVSDVFLTNWVSSYIGAKTGRDFTVFIRNTANVIPAEDILSGKAKPFNADFAADSAACYLTITKLSDALRAECNDNISLMSFEISAESKKRLANALRWITEGTAGREQKTFAVQDVCAAVPAISASLLPDAEFNKMVPKLNEISELNARVNNL